MAEDTGFLQKQLEGVEAKIQEEVGIFLQLKNRIQPYRMSSEPAIAQAAEVLYAQQVELERQLQETIKLIGTLKEEGISSLLVNYEEITDAYNFVNNLKDHKDQVKQFEALALGKAPAAGAGVSGAGMFGSKSGMLLALSAVAGLGYHLLKGRK
jgi:hypothetical protein